MHKKILIAMLIVVALPLISLWYTNYYRLEQEVEVQVNGDLTQTADGLLAKVNDWYEMNSRMLKQNVLLKSIQSNEEAQQEPVLKAITSTYEWTYLAYAIGQDGYKTARSDDVAILNADGTKAHFRGDRVYFKQIAAGNKMGQQVLMSRTLGQPAFILCEAIKYPQIPSPKPGALCIGMTVTKMSETITRAKIGETGYAILLDESNKVIARGGASGASASGGLEDMSDSPALVQAVSARGDKPYIYTSSNVKKIAYSVTSTNGWRLIVEQDYDDAFAPVIEAKRNSLILLIVTVVLTLIVSFFMAKRLAKPIQRLTGIADDISRGTFHNKIDESSRSDEIGDLAKAIERMSISISIAFRKLKAKK
ncbi:HAMP domain-containing protein [Gynuella sp.]|uniref:HAMP domain-containing protein n=1 Tax=Gynuella sp. TaxID=2969146 RepID=UPI003D126880